MQSSVKFTKMHGLGNDFIIMEEKDLPKNTDCSILASKLCNRHFGIGADGLIIVNPKNLPAKVDISWRIYNSDGSEPEMCGNGIRCFAKYVYDNKIVTKNKFSVTTLAGEIVPAVENGLVTVDMGKPVLNPAEIPVNISGDRVLDYPLTVLDKTFRINCVSMGNPHCVIFVDEPVDVVKYGSALETDNIFPQKTNVEFVKVISKDHIQVDVWERGCGITLACGTGACACTVAAVLNGLTEKKVKVTLPGGDLIIHFDESSGNVLMSGPAEYVFNGVCSI